MVGRTMEKEVIERFERLKGLKIFNPYSKVQEV
jgi:hypothetical protein